MLVSLIPSLISQTRALNDWLSKSESKIDLSKLKTKGKAYKKSIDLKLGPIVIRF